MFRKRLLKNQFSKATIAISLAAVITSSSLAPASAATRGTVTWKSVSQGINSANQYVYDGNKTDFTTSGRILMKGTVYGKNSGYIENGKVNTSKSGVLPAGNGWFLVRNGWVDFSANGLKTVNGEVYSFSGGRRVFTDNEIVMQYGNGDWRYMYDGKWISNYTGFARNSNGVWRIENGKVNFNYSGVIKDPCGITSSGAGWVYFSGGKFNPTANSVEKNDNGWWKITNGQVDFNFNGLAQNSKGTWLIQGGKVNFDYNGFGYGCWIQGGAVKY